MKKVVLLGDSIRLIGYGTKVPELLGDDFDVWQPSENCKFAKYTLRCIHDWKNNIRGADIIHWNNGLWDTCRLYDGEPFTSVTEYCDTVVKIAKVLLSYTKKLVFATTTPVNPKKKDQSNDDIRAYNEAVLPALKVMGVIINDLHSLVSENIDGYICEDNIHLSPLGIEVCAKQVANVIKKLAD